VAGSLGRDLSLVYRDETQDTGQEETKGSTGFSASKAEEKKRFLKFHVHHVGRNAHHCGYSVCMSVTGERIMMDIQFA
jgi:hypothetical protein